ncbi:23S rRNA pseudouridine1911/1915/1917 synthase [Candidatus Hakubella thermalkaliphila]|nr:23S rRNA pseudouridine1911/1915/1917 synthase [Candidatus Hakubella thermalkaliphila]
MGNEEKQGSKVVELEVEEKLEGQRLDTVLAQSIPELSRSQVQRLISEGQVMVDGQPQSKSYRVREKEIIRLTIPPPKAYSLQAEELPIKIVYEDEEVVVVSKEAGMVVHPSFGHTSGTLVNALLFWIRDLAGIGGVSRPGIIHRLDKNTSGLILVAKNDLAYQALARQLKGRSIKRKYLALVKGVIQEKAGVIKTLIARSTRNRKKMAVSFDKGKEAVTHFRVLERFKNCTLVEVALETGRTHQIRVHFSHIKHPVLGDKIYGGADKLSQEIGLERQFLHACELSFFHPGREEMITVTDQLPPELEEVLAQVRKQERVPFA